MNEVNTLTTILTDWVNKVHTCGSTLRIVFAKLFSFSASCIFSISICSFMKLATVPGIAACLEPSIKYSVSSSFSLPNSSMIGGTSPINASVIMDNNTNKTTNMEITRFFRRSLCWKKITIG